MKVTSSNNTEVNTNKKIDKQPAGSDFDSEAADGLMPGASEKSDFAGVLERVTRSHNESQTRHTERTSDNHNEARETKTREKDDKPEAGAYTPGTERPLTQPVAVIENKTDTPILHTVDLDNIVTACHVQLAANGQQQVTLELSHSMLEGLRVKVSTDAGGRITADFLAANEGIKSLLDNRSSELIDQLRSRGINLAEFKSSVAGDANGRNDSRREQQPRTGAERIASGTEAIASRESESITATEDGLATGATYRA